MSEISNIASVKNKAAQYVKKPTVDAALKPQANQQVNLETAKAVATAGNKILQSVNHSLSFRIDETTKQVVIKVVDSDTGELIRQIPTAEILGSVDV